MIAKYEGEESLCSKVSFGKSSWLNVSYTKSFTFLLSVKPVFVSSTSSKPEVNAFILLDVIVPV